MRPGDYVALDRAIRRGERHAALERAAERRPTNGRIGRRGGGGAPAFTPAQLGTVPVLGSSIYAQSANNLGISGASPWSVQMIVSPTTSADVVLASAFQVGADAALNGAYGGLSDLPATGCFFGAGDYATAQVFTPSRIVPTPLAWYLLTVTYDGTSIRTYVDGALVSTRTATLNLTNGKLILSGNVAHSGFWFTGAVARVGVWTRTLSAAEVLAAFANPATNVPASPAAFYRCNEGSGATLNDSIGTNHLTITGAASWVSAVARWPRWERIQETFWIGTSLYAGTAPTPGSIRSSDWALFSKKMNSCGTQTAVSGGAPAYSFYSEAFSGDTCLQVNNRVNGTWGNNTDFTLGSAGDPGPGSRGAMETNAGRGNGQGTGGDGAVLLFQMGTNELTGGALDLAYYEVVVKRAWNVYRGSGGSARKILIETIVPRTDSAPAQTRTDTANAGLVTVVANLNAAGYPAELVDTVTGFNTGTMLEDALHTNTTGNLFRGARLRPRIEA